MLEGTQLKTIEPYQPYNIFNCYYASNEYSREVQSLPYAFVNTDGYDRDAVIRFSEAFGLLGNEPALDVDDSVLHKLALSETASMQANALEVSEPPGNIRHNSLDVVSFRRLQRLMHEALLRIRKANTKEEAHRVLKNLIPQGHLRPYLVWDSSKGDWVTIWYVATLRIAMYLMLHLDLQVAEIKVCKRKDCRNWFKAFPRSTIFCSKRCRNTTEVRMKRARKEALNRFARGKEGIRRAKQCPADSVFGIESR